MQLNRNLYLAELVERFSLHRRSSNILTTFTKRPYSKPRMFQGMMITRQFLRSAFAMIAMLVFTGTVLAHDGHHHDDSAKAEGSRTWTIAMKVADLHGTFVAATGDEVQIRCDDNRLVTVKVERLAASDRQWIAHRLETIRRLNQQRELRLVVQHAPTNADAQGEKIDTRTVDPQAFRAVCEHLKTTLERRLSLCRLQRIPRSPDDGRNTFMATTGSDSSKVLW